MLDGHRNCCSGVFDRNGGGRPLQFSLWRAVDRSDSEARVRREVRGLVLAVAALLALVPAVAGCSHKDDNQAGAASSAPEAGAGGHHGLMFPQCGGVSDATVAELTRVSGLVNTARNSVGCQWLVGGGILGPHFSFSWYRGSPIGRERKTEELSRATVDDINIDGHSGFVALGNDPNLGDSLCEIGIQFQDDFIEWSVSFNQKPFPPACDVAKELARQSIANAK